MVTATTNTAAVASTNGKPPHDASLAAIRRHPSLKRTDTGNAERFALDHQNALRHAWGAGWHVWDGKRWAPDHNGRVVELAKDSARRTLWDANEIRNGNTAEAPGDGDEPETHEKRATKHAAWALRSQDAARLRAAIDLARSDQRLTVNVDELDADPDLLNTPSGTINLRTGQLRDHNPADLITKLAGADYQPDTRSDRLDRFLDDLTGGDTELADYIQRVAGYSATGHTGEEILAFVYGPAASGKTTLLETLRTALGDYATASDFATFLAGRSDGSSASPDIARLIGARLVTASEVAGGQRFNTARLKSITGGENIVARPLYRDPVQFRPQFTLWLAGNDRPAVPADDDAAWRRIRVVPLEHSVPADRRDPELKRALTEDPDERSAVLAWIIAGAVAWHRDGLGTCTAVENATGSYRADQDELADWIAARCDLRADATSMATALFDSYSEHARSTGDQPLTQRKFRAGLALHGVTRAPRRSTGYLYRGIELRRMYPMHTQTETSSIHPRAEEVSVPAAHRTQGAQQELQP